MSIDLSQELSAETVEEPRAIIHDHIVVIFPGQNFSPREQLRFARYFGPAKQRKLPDGYEIPKSSRQVPGIVYVSNIRAEDGKFDGVIPDGEMWFHHDTCYKPAPGR